MKRPNILKMALLGSTAVALPSDRPREPVRKVTSGRLEQPSYKIGDKIKLGGSNVVLTVTGIAEDGRPIVKREEKKRNRK